jgi:hypothetical protein
MNENVTQYFLVDGKVIFSNSTYSPRTDGLFVENKTLHEQITYCKRTHSDGRSAETMMDNIL